MFFFLTITGIVYLQYEEWKKTSMQVGCKGGEEVGGGVAAGWQSHRIISESI